MQNEHIHQFQERLNQWVANQGFWFQIRHSMLGGGFGENVTLHLFRLSLRLGIFLLVFVIGSWIYMIKRIDSKHFHESLQTTLQKFLSAQEMAVRSSRTLSRLEITRLGAEGGPDTFFSTLEARHVRCRMGLTDGLFGVWNPGVISIARLDVDLRAGADDAEAASSMADIIFSRPEHTLIRTIDVANASLHWGYSARTQGSITSSHLNIQRTESGWRLLLKGGTFSQNWLRDLEIVQMSVLCEPSGLFFEEARLRHENATVDFSGLRVEANARPQVKGLVRIKNLNLESVLPSSHHAILSGTFSTDLKVSGSTNTSDGITFEGMVTLDGSDVITIRDRVHVLMALSVVDYSHNYNRVDFNAGSFHLKTIGGGLQLKDIRLRADDLLTLSGELDIRLPDKDEVRSAVKRGLFAETSLFLGENRGKSLPFDPQAAKSTLKPTTNAAKMARDGKQSQDTMSLFDRLGLRVELRKQEVEKADLLSSMMRYQGELVITLPSDSFEHAPKLRQKYPVNPDTGRVPMKIPIEGFLNELTLPQAESVYEDGKR